MQAIKADQSLQNLSRQCLAEGLSDPGFGRTLSRRQRL